MLKVKERNDNANYSSSNTTNGNLIESATTTTTSPKLFEPQQGDYDVRILQAADTAALGHQIAGHSRTGVLKHKLGYVLKPLQKEPLGTREVGFYTKVFGSRKGGGFVEDKNDNCTIVTPVDHQGDHPTETTPNNNYLILQKYLPKFHGVVKILSTSSGSSNNDTGPEDVPPPTWKHYIALEDLVEGFSKPCVIDIKVGAKTWDPYAPPTKVAHEKSKYLGTKEPIGLSLTGMQYYDLVGQTTNKMEKELGKSLVVSTFIDTMYEFFNGASDPKIPNYIAAKLLPRLKEIQEYFQVQREFCFYSSSLLIGYDAQKFEVAAAAASKQRNSQQQNYNDDDNYADINTWLRVWMIDFAHVFPIDEDNPGPDTNYQFGLNNLIKICNVLEQRGSSSTSTEIVPSSSSDSE